MSLGPSDLTSSGLSLFTVERMMEARVNRWAARKLRERIVREAVIARRDRLRNVVTTALGNPTVTRVRG